MAELISDDIESTEVFAFQLMLHEHQDSEEEIEKGRNLWRSESQDGLLFRKNYRSRAGRFLQNLKANGLSVRRSSQAKVSKSLHDIQLIPARQAYDLEQELAPTTDGPPQLEG